MWTLGLLPRITSRKILWGPKAASVCGWCKLRVFKYADESNFTFSRYLTNWSHMTFDLQLWPLITWTHIGSYIVSINQQIGSNRTSNFIFWAHLTAWPLICTHWYMVFDHMVYMVFDHMNIKQHYCINKANLVPKRLQLLKRGHVHYVTFDLINKCAFPCYIY